MTFGPACDWCGGCSYDGSDDNPRCPWCKKLKSRGSRASLVEQLQEAEKKITALTNELTALRQRVPQPCGVPTEPGFYWAKWMTASPKTLEGDHLTPADHYEVVEVWENFIGEPCESDATEKFGVSVAGVRETQWLENFLWGEGPIMRMTCPPPAGDKGGE